MPYRPWVWWRAYKGLSHRDPTALVFAFAVYALLYGTSLLLPGESFDISPVFSVVRELVPESAAGAGMVLDGVLLLVCLGWRLTPQIRSLVAIFTGAGWCFWGGLLLLGGLRVRYFSPGGAWTLLCALIVMQSTSGWVYPLMRPPPFDDTGDPLP